MYESNRESLNDVMSNVMLIKKIEDNVTPAQITNEYKEAIDIFPALHKYKKEHSIANLRKLCVEMSEFCRAIYSSTTNDSERKVYFEMLDKLKKV